MLVYLVIKESELLRIISSKFVELNTLNKNIFTQMPQLDAKHMAIKFYLNASEKKDILKQQASSSYYLNRTVNLEGRNFKILFNDEEQLESFKRLSLLYKEIKFNEEDNKLCCLKYLKEHNYTSVNIRKEFLLQEYEVAKNTRVNKIKGMLYGLVSEYDAKNYVLENYAMYFQEFNQISKLMNDLRANKKLSKDLYKEFNQLRHSLGKKVIESINNLNKETLIFEINEKKEIVFRNLFLSLSPLERNIFEFIINKVVDFTQTQEVYEKDILADVINELDNFVKLNPEYNIFLDDLQLILDRVLEKSYETDVEKIKSMLFKNLYATYIKINNLNELYSFLTEKSIGKTYLSLGIYGAIKGFSAMPRSSIINIEKDIWGRKLIEDALYNVENQYYSLQNNKLYTRNKLYYFLNNISVYFKNEEKYSLLYCDIFVLKMKGGYQLNIKTKDFGEMIIKFYPRVDNLAQSINYFDSKIEKVKKIYSNFKYNSSFYFFYYFKNDTNAKLSNLYKEYIFAILLKEIFYVIKGVK